MIRHFIALLYCSLLCIMAGCGNTAADQAQEAEARQMAALYGENRELPAADSTLTYAVKTGNGFLSAKSTTALSHTRASLMPSRL